MNLTLYSFLKFLHVLMAIIAVGFNASYGLWLARAAREPEHAGHVLRGIKILDDRFATPAYVMLLILGMAMVWESGIGFSTFWIAASLVLYVVVVGLAIAGFTPSLQRQVQLAESGQAGSEEYRQVAKRSARLGGMIGVVVLVIIFFMVTKPTL